jgi:hypothetical protein
MRRVAGRPLWLGHRGDARDPAALLSLGIIAVIDLAAEEPFATLPREIVYCRFPLADGPDNPRWIVRSAVETLAGWLREGIPTLVSCGAGMSRSPAITAAALAIAEGRPIEECLAEIVEGGVCDVSPAFWRDLCDLA